VTVTIYKIDSAVGPRPAQHALIRGRAAQGRRGRQAKEPAYIAHVALAETGIATEDGWRALEPEMTVTAEIKAGRRRVIRYLLSPLLRYRSGAMRER
jgi:hypothetical protein